ncbi:CoB--CoM heterodisulfide reductase subunit C [Methanocaldococcus infernus]|uniref:CoB/CoM heterodisulfide reductase, subunit C n=1 Tax=Methanocaldococcus infernus (strain DSM 11812 / JCM 15783 / ME) TaxID=573063 RepID=D5VRG4_METIM|nr:CoB--CoM heterodisulfide reductase subunit C [Methanocaldococcus infernus]ADG13167.1 CoB/CoM heterodisulfide reductase, subunit C [Methanocaldococcus infernus ME]
MVLTNKDFDPKFSEEIIKVAEEIGEEEVVKSFRRCYQCGTCTGGCPSGRHTAYRVRVLIRSALMGFYKYIESEDLWMCTTCYTCYERCPRDVKITEIIKAMRNLAARLGLMAEAHRKTCLYVYLTGHAVPINDKIKEVRKKLGLSEVPPTTYKYPEVLEHIRGIMQDMKLCEKVGICPTSKTLKELTPVKWEEMSE